MAACPVERWVRHFKNMVLKMSIQEFEKKVTAFKKWVEDNKAKADALALLIHRIKLEPLLLAEKPLS